MEDLPPGSPLAPATSCSQLSGTFIFTSSFLENLTEYLRQCESQPLATLRFPPLWPLNRTHVFFHAEMPRECDEPSPDPW